MVVRFLLFFFIVLVAVFQWRTWRARSKADAASKPQPRPRPPESTTPMVACQQCGLHVPAADAVSGSQGVYCSTAHRQLHEH